MRKAILLLLSCSFLTQLIAQPSNDDCSTAKILQLKTPFSCPESNSVTDTFQYHNAGAAPSVPFPALPGCSGEAPESGADVWFQFAPTGNSMAIRVDGELETPFIALFESGQEGCSGAYPIACASGDGSLELSTYVDPTRLYYLLVSGGDAQDQGEFRLSLTTTNQCSPCILGRQGFFTMSPAPENGAFLSGQEVQMCYVVNRWNASSGGEYLHSLELRFGPGWDESSFTPSPPPSCSGEGIWGYFDGWENNSGQQFGPGFAFDGPFIDGNPGNNRGLSGEDCANIGLTDPPLSFCWTITAAECTPGDYGIQNNLGLSVRMLGDGVSGLGTGTLCFEERWDHLQAALHCPDPFAPEAAAIDASCGDNCDGSLIITGGGDSPWDYAVTDSSGQTLYTSANSTGADTVPDLCPGHYLVHVFNVPTGENRVVAATVGTTAVPQASADYGLPCIEGEPIHLYGQADPSAGATYRWTGPNGFSSSNKNPLALYPGTYTLVVTVDSCSSAPFELVVPPIEQAVVEIAEDTLTACPGEPVTITTTGNATAFTWYASNSDTSVGSGPSITVMPEDGATYRVTGVNDKGCVGFDEVTVSIPFHPEVSADTSGTLCPGTSVTLTASEGEQFLWSTGDTTASITVSPEQSTIYYLQAEGPDGCSVQLSAAVSVASAVGTFISPDAAICEGESTNLFASGGDISWSTGDSISTITVSPLQTTTYSASITNSLGCVFLRETTVTVRPAPAIVLTPADTAYLCQGDSLQLLAYESDSLIWESWVSPAQSRDYILPGAADYGCREIGHYTVIVYPLPTLSIEGEELLCSGDSLLLVANSNGTLSWSTGEDNDSIYVLPAGTETYSVTATGANGCTRTDSIQATQASPPDAPQVSCSSSLGTVVFSWVAAPGLTYSLSHLQGPAGVPIGNNLYVVTGLLPGQTVSIELEAANAAGCTAAAPASCSAPDCSVLSLSTDAPDEVCSDSGPVPLAALVTGGADSGIGAWAGPGADGATDTFHPDIAGGGIHELVYTYTEAGCTLSDTVEVLVVQAFDAAMVECAASPGSVTFSWPGLPQYSGFEVSVLSGQSGHFINSTTYRVDGLASGEEVKVEIRAVGGDVCPETVVASHCTPSGCPTLAAPADTMICAGEKALLAVSPSGWDTFEWTPADGLSCDDCPAPFAAPSATTTYTLVATNAAGCADTVTTTVYVGEIPDAYIPDTPIFFCEGDPLEICLPDVGAVYWIGPDAFLGSGPCLSFSRATADLTGPYFVLIQTGTCLFSKRFELKAAPPIEVEGISGFQGVCPDEVFTVFVEAPGAVSYSWSPAEYLECPTCPLTNGMVPQTATFTVEMTDSYGCTTTETAVVFVDACPARPTPPANAQEAAALHFFPNPATANVQLELPGEGAKAIQLWSGSGKLIRELQTSEQAFTLSLEGVPGGAYLLRMVSGQEVRTGWLVVRE